MKNDFHVGTYIIMMYFTRKRSELTKTYPMMLLFNFSLGNDRNLPKLTQWCYYGIFHSEMFGTYQNLPNDDITAFSIGNGRNLLKLTQWCYYGIFHMEIIGTYQILRNNVTMVF
jgi:hypothetical protein